MRRTSQIGITRGRTIGSSRAIIQRGGSRSDRDLVCQGIYWRVVKWYHTGLWSPCSRFESWLASLPFTFPPLLRELAPRRDRPLDFQALH